jgi:hypothetical protein
MGITRAERKEKDKKKGEHGTKKQSSQSNCVDAIV